ncbi:hypothetical protein [Sphaerospermopsis torques-reginae]|nr:hypothetical protein [Sphaerospermopsis torques-reginae]
MIPKRNFGINQLEALLTAEISDLQIGFAEKVICEGPVTGATPR